LDRPDLELVLAVRRHGSLVAASRALRLAPTVVTKRLAALEARLGIRLFQRTTRRVSPTADGETLCERAQVLLHLFESAEAELRERQAEPSGPIRIAATFGFGRLWLGPALATFQSLYPKVSVQVQLTEHLPDLVVEGLDGAIWLWDAPSQRAGEWISRKLAANQRVLVAAPAYLRRRGTPRTPEDLVGHDCLVVRENGGTDQRHDHWRLRKEGEERWTHTPVHGPLSSNSGELVRDWCIAGHGIMLRSLWDVTPQIERGELIRVLSPWSMPEADVHWIAPYRAQVPRRIRLLVDFLAERFQDEPWRRRSARAVSVPAAPPGSRRKR
jgi:LysR family transcriptional regulator, transcriptional activator for dmlA